jgi:putative transposase
MAYLPTAGAKVPQKQHPQGRISLNNGNGPRLRLRLESPNHVWSYDFVAAFTHDGRQLKIVALINEHSHEYLGLHVEPRLVLGITEALAAMITTQQIPAHLR